MSKMKNIKKPIFVIDFEGSKKIGIVEYGIVKVLGGEIVSCSTRICAPKEAIPTVDAQLFGITTQKAKAFAPFEADLDKFCKMRKDGVFAAHNATAEDTMLRAICPSPTIVENLLTGKKCASWAPYIDTCALSKRLFNLRSSKLADVVSALNLEDELFDYAEKFCPENRRKWHCALFDAIASALILIKICSFDGFEDVSIAWLLKFSKSDSTTQQDLL